MRCSSLRCVRARPTAAETPPGSYCLMIVHCVLGLMREDVALPASVWSAVLDTAVSDVSHLRKARSWIMLQQLVIYIYI